MELLDRIRDALLTVTENVYHYEAHKESDSYIVWMEHQAHGQWADNDFSEQIITGTAEYYTKQEYDPLVEKIEEALASVALTYWLNFTRYDPETGYTLHEWSWQI